MDINKGPLERADAHILEHGLDGKIVTRLSDGLVNLKMKEADTMIAAGMGGGLVIHILNEDPAKTRSLKELDPAAAVRACKSPPLSGEI